MGADILSSSNDAVAVPAPPSVEAKVTAPVVTEIPLPAPVKVAPAVATVSAAPAAAHVPAPATHVTSDVPASEKVVTEDQDVAIVPAVGSAEELLLKRAARFGIQPVPAVLAKVEESKKDKRAERFGLTPAESSKPYKGVNKNNNNNTGKKEVNNDVQAVIADPEIIAKLQQRVGRFGVISNTLQQVQKVQVQAEEVRIIHAITDR